MVQCPSLEAFDNGGLNLSGDSKYTSIATYSCNDGYTLMGDSKRVCAENGAWSGSEPFCSSELSNYIIICRIV